MKKYTSLFYFLACMFSAHAQVADKITVINDAGASSNPSPSSYSQEVRFHFKWNGAIGIPSVGSPGPGTYSALMTVAPWSDGTGSKHHQLNFNEQGLYWRKGLFGSSWESWKKIIVAEPDGNVSMGPSGTSIYWDWPSRVIEQYSPDGNSQIIRFRNSMSSASGNTNGGFDFAWHDGTSVMRIINGNVGINTPNPVTKLHIKDGAARVENETESSIQYKANAPSQFWDVGTNVYGFYIYEVNSASYKMVINKNGDVGIGTLSPDKRLTVNGTIHAKEVQVDLNVPGPDYVFEKDYDLLSLTELETYITQNKHLPEVPSAKEMEVNGLRCCK